MGEGQDRGDASKHHPSPLIQLSPIKGESVNPQNRDSMEYAEGENTQITDCSGKIVFNTRR